MTLIFCLGIKLWIALLLFEGLQAVVKKLCEAGGDFIKTTHEVISLLPVMGSVETTSCVVMQNHVRFCKIHDCG